MNLPKNRRCAVCSREYMPNSAAHAWYGPEEYKRFLENRSVNGCDVNLRCLDGRYLSETARSELVLGVEYCIACRYCNFDISVASDSIKKLVNSFDYKAIVGDGERPKLAIRYLCAAFIAERDYKFNIAAEAMRYAAWCFDDENNQPEAQECRIECIRLLQMVLFAGLELNNFGKNITLIIIDMYRRSGKFSEADKIIKSVLYTKNYTNNSVRALLEYQQKIIAEYDYNKHTVGDITKWEGYIVLQQRSSEEASAHIKNEEASHFDNNKMYSSKSDSQDKEYNKNNTSKFDKMYPGAVFNNQNKEYGYDFNEMYFDAMTDGQYGDYDEGHSYNFDE